MVAPKNVELDSIPDKEVREWYKHIQSNQDQDQDQYFPLADKYPTILEIESTSRCNVNPPCPMCNRVWRVKHGVPEYDMPWFIMDKIEQAIISAKSISISGVGEPMMAECFEKMLQLGEADISFFSHGQVLTDKKLGQTQYKLAKK